MLSVANIKKSYDKKTLAVRNVSFELYEGQILGLVGESGSGKSTLIYLIAGLLKSDSGDISFKGKNLQLVFQNPAASFDPRMTLGASLKEAIVLSGVKNKGLIKKRIQELFHEVELPGTMENLYPHQVSGGQCQRAAIARALSRNPDLLVCDEPVSSLDLMSQAKVLNLFLKLQKQKRISIILASHDLRVIRHVCDRVIVLKEGEIREQAQTSDLFCRPQDAYTRELLESSGVSFQA